MNIGTRIRRSAAREDGFTMIIAIMVLFVSSLLVAAVFVGAQGDVSLTRANTNQKDAYYAAMAGISAYKYQLNANTTYWQKCPSIANGTVPGSTGAGTTEETYKVKTLPATGHSESQCLSVGASAILEATGSATGTFRIESTGIAAKGTKDEAKRSLVATFTHPGYLNYVYLSNFEEADPETTGGSESECEFYRKEREAKKLTNCASFPWIPADKIEGPFHTNDTAEMYGSPVFGRSGHNDAIEMNGGYTGGTPKFEGAGYTTKGETLLPPEVSATELLSEAGAKYAGRTLITLEGTKMTVTAQGEGRSAEILPFPANGVIAVENGAAGCPSPSYAALETNYPKEKELESNCGNVFIRGTYTQSLTVIAQNDVIITGSLTTEGGTSGGEPKGSAALGLIAMQHARLYHPIKECEETVPQSASAEAEVTEGSTIINNVSPTSSITIGAEVTGTKIKSGSTVLSANLAKGEVTISHPVEETEIEVEVTEKSAILKKVPTTSGIRLGAEISGTKIKPGSTVTSVTNLAKGEVTISNVVEGSGTGSKKEKIKISGQTGKETVQFITKVKVVVSCKNTEDTCPNSANATASERPAEEFGGPLNNPVIDAAVLSTKHSWGVDNFSCGGPLGEITIWGSIAENFRGRVTCCLSGGDYVKNYKYDERLKTIQPPDFLAPSSTEVTLSRVTAPPNGFGEG